jgi:hypothetical protein
LTRAPPAASGLRAGIIAGTRARRRRARRCAAAGETKAEHLACRGPGPVSRPGTVIGARSPAPSPRQPLHPREPPRPQHCGGSPWSPACPVWQRRRPARTRSPQPMKPHIRDRLGHAPSRKYAEQPLRRGSTIRPKESDRRTYQAAMGDGESGEFLNCRFIGVPRPCLSPLARLGIRSGFSRPRPAPRPLNRYAAHLRGCLTAITLRDWGPRAAPDPGR